MKVGVDSSGETSLDGCPHDHRIEQVRGHRTFWMCHDCGAWFGVDVVATWPDASSRSRNDESGTVASTSRPEADA